ncbi:MAG: hypothetical protein ACE5EA_08790 [Nitrospirota bacterium]
MYIIGGRGEDKKTPLNSVLAYKPA